MFMGVKYTWEKNIMAGLMETEHLSAKFTNIDKTQYDRQVGIILYLSNELHEKCWWTLL
jgi:hypothetical protein